MPPPGVAGRLAFDARFSGSRLDTSVWSTCYPWATSTAPGCTIYGNGEAEWYLPSQDRVSHGVLHLTSQPVRTGGVDVHGDPKDYACRSGLITSYPGFRFTYGYVQVVARIPSGYGLWPALWLAPTNLDALPEIDMLEQWGPPKAHATVTFHPAAAHQVDVGARPAKPDLPAGWHTIGLDWTPTALTWFIDGHQQLSVHQNIPHQPMYFIANLADYRPPQAGTGCDGSMLIRSVKVWQHR